ncbi:MAG: ATP synthase F0 subunit B [Proteobacteria bacterium]|nr:ATP synthase F0 subunit B [Pseudomonadota bacterium]
MAQKNSPARVRALIVCIILILVAFGLHYGLKIYFGLDGKEVTTALEYFVMTFAPQVGNAGIVFVLLWWFGAPMLSKMISDRKDKIEHDIQESAHTKELAEAVRADADVKMSRLPAEIKQIKKGYEEMAVQDCERIANEAQHTVENLKKDAQVAFELQAGVAKRAFEAEIMDMAIEKARIEIASKLAKDSALRDRLIEQSIASIEI